MITRRDLLRSTGWLAAGVGLSACGTPSLGRLSAQAARLDQLCERLSEPDPRDWEAGVRSQFRRLECLTTALRASPSLERTLGSDVTRRYWRLHGKLASADYARSVTEMWRLFYELTSRLHEQRNARARKSKLPVYAYNGHQHAARLWMDEAVRRQARGPLLHFDTHRDMRPLHAVDDILKAVKRLSEGGRTRTKALKKLRRLINDHATPVTAGVLGRAVSDVIWAYPHWSYAAELVQRPVFYAHVPRDPGGLTGYRLLHDRHEDPRGGLPEGYFGVWAEVEQLKGGAHRGLRHKRSFRLSHVPTLPTTANTLRSLCRVVPRGRFILDIDTDYFLSIDHDSGFQRPSGTVRDRLEQTFDYRRRLDDARRLVDTRLSELKQLLLDFRKAGRVPSVITLADSTYMPFATTLAGRGYWEYMPFEFAAYVHWEVRRLLAEVYRREGIEAGV